MMIIHSISFPLQLDVSLSPGGYLGLSGDSGHPGQTGTPDDILSERISIWNLHTYNTNLTVLGEEPTHNFQEGESK